MKDANHVTCPWSRVPSMPTRVTASYVEADRFDFYRRVAAFLDEHIGPR